MADDVLHSLLESLQARFTDALLDSKLERHEVTIEVKADKLREVCLALRDEFHFEQLMDVCGLDYSLYGVDEWSTSTIGFSRGVAERAVGRSALAVKKATKEPRGR